MKNFKNIFIEYQDPKVIRNLKWGFALLVVLGILITFVAAPSLRHFIIPEHKTNIGNNQVVTKQHRSLSERDPQSLSRHKDQQSKGKSPSKGKEGSDSQPGGSVNGNRGDSTIPSNPSSPPPPKSPGSSTENEPTSKGNGGQSGSSKPGNGNSNGEPGTETGKDHNSVPPITKLPPPLDDPGAEGVGNTVHDTVNGVTDQVNGVTSELPVQVEIPKVCILKPC